MILSDSATPVLFVEAGFRAALAPRNCSIGNRHGRRWFPCAAHRGQPACVAHGLFPPTRKSIRPIYDGISSDMLPITGQTAAVKGRGHQD